MERERKGGGGREVTRIPAKKRGGIDFSKRGSMEKYDIIFPFGRKKC